MKKKIEVPNTWEGFWRDRTKALLSDISFGLFALLTAIVVSYIAKGLIISVSL